jgi:hypothetical protein
MQQPSVPRTMTSFLADSAPNQPDLLLLFNALQTATKLIANKVPTSASSCCCCCCSGCCSLC